MLLKILFVLEWLIMYLTIHPLRGANGAYKYEAAKLRESHKRRWERFEVNKRIRQETKRLSKDHF